MLEIEEIKKADYREVVLAGIHLGNYGNDLPGKVNLAVLLHHLANNFRDLRIRLGSMQPQEVTPEIIEMLCDENISICEHLHLSLQLAAAKVQGGGSLAGCCIL